MLVSGTNKYTTSICCVLQEEWDKAIQVNVFQYNFSSKNIHVLEKNTSEHLADKAELFIFNNKQY